MGRDRRLDEEEQASATTGSRRCGGHVRASSAVECMNSVLRMQQSRHKRMTQPMLDLKRLYWNCQSSAGSAEEGLPLPGLGLDLPTFDFWTLLQTDPSN